MHLLLKNLHLSISIRIYIAKQNIKGAALSLSGFHLVSFPSHSQTLRLKLVGQHSESQCRNVAFINSKRHCVRSTHRDEEYGEILTWTVEKKVKWEWEEIVEFRSMSQIHTLVRC